MTAGSDCVETTTSLDALSAGAIGWLLDNLDFFDPFSARSEGSPHGKVKAALELALLRHCWARRAPDDERLAEIAALVRRLWQLPDFQHLITSQPAHGSAYRLIYTALPPEDIDPELRNSVLAQLGADGYLTSAGKSSYLCLETRFYADKAGARHALDSYEKLIEQSIFVELPTAMPVTIQEAYTITHTSFYLSDFGRKRPDLAPETLERAIDLSGRMLDYCVAQDMWDLTAEFLITLFNLGDDPLNSASGAAGLACLARAQLPNGAIPGRSAKQMPAESASPGEFFHKVYHTTLAVILMSMIISSPRGLGSA